MPEMFCYEKDGMIYVYRSTSEYNPDAQSKRYKSEYVEQAFNVLKNDLDGDRWRTSNPQTAKDRLLVKFVALIIWFTVLDLTRDLKDRIPVQTVVQTLDTIMAIGDGIKWGITKMTAKSHRILDALRVDRPKQVITTEPYEFIPSMYLE